jgi:hypothetical protein
MFIVEDVMNGSIAELTKTLNALYKELGTWHKVGERYGVSRTVAWRIARAGYEPKNNATRRLLGLPEMIKYTVRRNSKGRFSKRS